ncbi:MAG TPA: NUDIX hydrolase [Solirubrobacteraceae bacterium]|nr:NUDIX hydrolase [Solirubrobacteraceae bacterium]
MSERFGFEQVGSEECWRGAVIGAGTSHYRHADGAVVARDTVWHPGAVAVLAVDDEHVWLTRQPREVAGLTDSLEVPAGKLDVPGESPLACARRELGEEIAKQAEQWREVRGIYTSVGYSDEYIWLFLAQGLRDSEDQTPADEDERIEIIPWPLTELEAAISASDDAKTVIALQWLALERAAGRL